MVINWFALFIVVCVSILVIGIKKIKYIDAFVFFIPFNATVVFFTPDKTAINLPFLLFFLAAISFFFRRIFSAKFSIPKNRKTISQWLFIIALIIIFSQIMPYIINGSYKVLERYKETVYWAKEHPLYPSMQWITQSLYFLIGLLVVFIININYKTKNEIKKLLKILISGITFMVFWGWFADLTFILNIPYPQFFNHIGMYQFGVGAETLYGYPRMSSVTMEPSYFAQILIPITPFFYWFHQEETAFVFNNKYHKFMYILSLLSLIIAITTTGILGFFVLIGLLLINNFRFFSLRSKYFLTLLFISVFFVTIFYLIKYLTDVNQTYSGIERFKTVIYGIKYFKDYPILGLGWGVFPTYDFLINLLVNFGLLGTIPFILFLAEIFRRFRVKINKTKKDSQNLYKPGFESFLLILLVSQLSGFIYHSQYFWLYIGMAISIASLEIPKKVNKCNLHE